MVFLRPTILPDNERLLSMTRQKYMGITALQFELNNQGELEQVVRDPLPVSLEQVFEGRKNVSPEFREAYDAQQNAPAKEAEVEESESQ